MKPTKFVDLAPVDQAIKSFEAQAMKSPELAREAFWRLLDNIRHFQNSAMRSFTLMIFFALAFELLNRGLVSEASVGAVKLAKLDTLKFIFPVAIGYKYFTAVSAVRDRNIMASAYVRVSDAVYPKLHDSGIDSLLSVPSGLVTSLFPWVYVDDTSARLVAILSALEHAVAALVLPVALPAYTLVQVFRQDGADSWQAWTSLVLTVTTVVAGLAVMYIQSRAVENA